MAPKLTEYERRKLENVKRNEEVLAALKIQSRASELSSISKRQRPQSKIHTGRPAKKHKTEETVVLRRSPRISRAPPDVSVSGGLKDTQQQQQKGGLRDDFNEIPYKVKPKPGLKSAPERREVISMADAYSGVDSNGKLIHLIRSFSRKSEHVIEKEVVGDLYTRRQVCGAVDLASWNLKPDYVSRVVPGWIMDVKLFPTNEKTLVVAGNKSGNIGFWNVVTEEEDNDSTYLYHPHTAPVSGIVIDPFSMSKIFTSSYDGSIRMMDIEREMFDSVYLSKSAVYAVSGRPQDLNSLYFSEGSGDFDIWDLRAGKSSATWNLHESKIHTIDFNSENTNLMATSSANGTACIWDLRHIHADKPVPLKVIRHKNGVQSAYFSPSGRILATTSIDLTVGISGGNNYKDICSIRHLNIGKGVSAFRGIWGWDDSYVYIGNMKRGVDVISVAEERVVATLESEYMTATPYRFDAHRCRVGVLAGASSVGEVYIWTSS